MSFISPLLPAIHLEAMTNIVNLLTLHPHENQRQAVWPYPSNGDQGMRSFEERLPKAANATDSIMRYLEPVDATTQYKVQEKLNGVYFLWDGRNLWTKTGHRIDAPPHFLAFLPPAFAIVGELFFGYGHKEFEFAKTVARNALPSTKLMQAGANPNARSMVWQHARVVGFDIPEFGYLPYSDRHRLLWQIVGSWSLYLHEKSNLEYGLMPLQVVVQYPLSKLPALFKEVVHGATWAERVHIPFGVPFCYAKSTVVNAAGNNISYRAAAGEFFGKNVTELDRRQVLFGEAVGKKCAGEGLMLWEQDAVWQARGASGRTTRAILKYKPKAISVGLVTSPEPQHTHRLHRKGYTDEPQDDPEVGEDVEDGGRLPGYTVSLDWWDNLMGRWIKLRPYISANLGAKRCASQFAQDQKVFFTFVMYDQHPQFMRALGPHLSHWDALSVQTMSIRAGKGKVAALTPGQRMLLARPLDQIRDANTWENGEIAILFPTSFDWSLTEWLQYSMPEHSRRVTANPALNPDKAWKPSVKNAIYAKVQAAIQNYKRKQADAVLKTDKHLELKFDNWLANRATFLPRFFVCTTLIISAWMRQRGATTDWWGDQGIATIGLVQHWGPFHISVPRNAGNATRWIGSQLGVVLTMVASVWLRYGGALRSTWGLSSDNMGPDRAEHYIQSLEASIQKDFIPTQLHKRWEDPQVKKYIHPPEIKHDPFNQPPDHHYSLSTIGRYFMEVVTANRTGTPVNLMKISFGGGNVKEETIAYVLDAQEALDSIVEVSDGIKTLINTAIQYRMDPAMVNEPWQLRAEELPLDRMTLLPQHMALETPEVLVAEPLIPVNDELAASRREVRRWMMMV